MHMLPNAPKLYRDTDPRSGPSLEMMVAQATRRYPIDSLHELRKTLPLLKCDLTKFSADAWRAQLIRPPNPVNELVVFPADFPRIGRRKRSQIPDQRIHAGLNDKSSQGEAADPSDKKNGRKRPVLPPLVFSQPSATERDVGFERFLETVPSPTHKRVTAGGRVVPAEPGSVSPVAANKTPFIPPHIAALQASPVLVQPNPGMPPVLYQPIASVAALGHQSHMPPPPAETMPLNSPPSGNVSVPAQESSNQHAPGSSNTAANNVANPLMDVTNRSRIPYPEYEWERRLRLLQEHANRIFSDIERNAAVEDERYGIRKVEYDAALEEIGRLSAAIKDSQRKRSQALQEQSVQSRLSRVNGPEADSGVVRQNFEWWTNNLMTDCGAFLSHAEILRHAPATEADLHEIQQILGATGQENLSWLGTRDVFEQSSISAPLSNQHPVVHDGPGNGFPQIVSSPPQESVATQSNIAVPPHLRAGSGLISKPPHMFGLDGGASLPDEGESNQPTSEDLLTELQYTPEMTNMSSGYVKVPTKTETDPFRSQFSIIDKYWEDNLQTEPENLASPLKVKGTRGGVVNSANEYTKTRGDFENTRSGNPYKAPPSVSSDLNSNFSKSSISSLSPTNTDPFFDSSRYMRTINSKGQIKTVLRTKAAEADLLKSKNKLQMKAMSSQYRDALKEENVKKAKDTESQKAFLNAMMKDPRYASANLEPEKFNEAVTRELERRQERAKSLATIIEDVEPSMKTNIGDYVHPKKDTDKYWDSSVPGSSCKTGILIDFGDSDDNEATDEKPSSGPGLQADKSENFGTSKDATESKDAKKPKKGPEYKKMGEFFNDDKSDDDQSDKPDPDEVHAFFDRLRREEEEEIEKYRAEHPL